MTIRDLDRSQRTAARVVGFAYLFAMATAMLAQFFVAGRLVVANDALETARNIVAHERLFRLGLASMYLCFLTDVALIAALYVVLSRVNPHLALFAAFMRLVETSIGVAALLNQFAVLRFLSDAPYLRAFGPGQAQALARVPLTVAGLGLSASFVPLGIGSAVFAYLWLKSGYIPRALALLGLVGSVLMLAATFAFIVFPEARNGVELACYVPMFLFEVAIGFWLLLKGLRPSVAAGAATG